MKCVRLPLLSRDFLLGHVDAESLVRHHPDCKDLLIEALKFHLLPEQRGVLGTSRTRPRRCEGAGPVLFAVGMLSSFSFPFLPQAIYPNSEYEPNSLYLGPVHLKDPMVWGPLVGPSLCLSHPWSLHVFVLGSH